MRSEENVALKYFVSLVPRRGRARASWDKANLAVQCREKVLTLDYPYIELNKEFLAALRVDCDGIFSTPDACVMELLGYVRNNRIPCLPHIIVGDRLEDGRFVRPHFVWLLPYGTAVWNSSDPRCRKAPIRLFDAVCRGLTSALIDIGADPFAPTMTMRMKCPTSPLWHTITPNSDVWPTLSEYAEYVDTGASRSVLARRAAAIQSGLGLTASNALFDGLRTEGKRLLAEWHFAADSRMRGTRAAIGDHLHEALLVFAAEAGLPDTQIGHLSGKVSDYLAHKFDAAKLENPGVSRGRLLHLVEGMPSVAARQAVGGRHAARAKADRALTSLVDAHGRLARAGRPITKTALAEAAGVSRRTVINRWSELVAAVGAGCENQCIDKKAPASSPALYEQPSPPERAGSEGAETYSRDSRLVAGHEGRPARKASRRPRPEIMNTISASVGPASPVPGRYADAPAADVGSEIACANSRVIPVGVAMLAAPICSSSIGQRLGGPEARC